MQNPFELIDARLMSIENLLLEFKGREQVEQLPPVEEEILTRQQTAKRLKISLPTLNELTKTGKIKGYRIGNRVRYKASEVENVLTQIKTR